jgi:hypothetical protein
MAEKETGSGKVAAAGLVGATGAAILTYFLTKGRKAEAAPPPEGTTVFTPDDETWNLLVGILEGIVGTNAKLDAVINAINTLSVSLGGSTVLANPKGGVSDHVICGAVGTAIQLPDYPVPWDKPVIIKALNGNAQPCRVGFTKLQAENLNTAWPLLRNEAKGWKVDNANRLWVCFAAATDGIVWSVEQET